MLSEKLPCTVTEAGSTPARLIDPETWAAMPVGSTTRAPVTFCSRSGPVALSRTEAPETASTVRLTPPVLVTCSMPKVPEMLAPPTVSYAR